MYKSFRWRALTQYLPLGLVGEINELLLVKDMLLSECEQRTMAEGACIIRLYSQLCCCISGEEIPKWQPKRWLDLKKKLPKDDITIESLTR